MDLTSQEIPQHYLELLNLRPNFVPTYKKLPFKDIVNATEIYALSLVKENQIENAELLRRKISNAISKNINFKIKNNLTLNNRHLLKNFRKVLKIKFILTTRAPVL